MTLAILIFYIVLLHKRYKWVIIANIYTHTIYLYQLFSASD